jgi:hypothetical protein
MWDQFRGKDDEETPFFQDDTPEDEVVEEEGVKPQKISFDYKKFTKEPILGMTPAQRFIIVIMLFMTVCILGAMFMFVTEKFYLF